MSAAPNLDLSWDVGELKPMSGGYIATRPRPEQRPQKRKSLLAQHIANASDRNKADRTFKDELDDTLRTMRSEFRSQFRELDIRQTSDRLIGQIQQTVSFNDTTEWYEAITRSFQGLNDKVFNIQREPINAEDVVLNVWEKETLKLSGLGFPLQILTPEQQHLCRALANLQEHSNGERNFIHHPRPDRETVMDRLREFLDQHTLQTLFDLLDTNPQRIPSRYERTQSGDPDLFLFSQPGQYVNVKAQRKELEALRAAKADTKAYLVALEQEAEAARLASQSTAT
ncbi:hypothetical protein B0H12DRAFT_1076258 [Mycena haematopus]|nr:hypothetical protein B0H12DRAFT_1076258 [Mycena haematopus]